jgi:hypothetical protein
MDNRANGPGTGIVLTESAGVPPGAMQIRTGQRPMLPLRRIKRCQYHGPYGRVGRADSLASPVAGPTQPRMQERFKCPSESTGTITATGESAAESRRSFLRNTT